MRTLSTYLGTAVMVASLLGCVPTDPNDILTTITSATLSDTNTATDTDPTDPTDSSSETGGDTATGDGDGDATTNGDGDGDPATTNGDGDGDGPTGCFNCPCGPNGECDDGLICDETNTCTLDDSGSDTDTDMTTDTGGDDAWDPNNCQPPSQPLMVGEIEGAFCSAPCTDSVDCPAGPPGTNPQCALVTMEGGDPEFCALVCMPGMDACPAGSTCKDVPNQPGVGLCTYP